MTGVPFNVFDPSVLTRGVALTPWLPLMLFVGAGMATFARAARPPPLGTVPMRLRSCRSDALQLPPSLFRDGRLHALLLQLARIMPLQKHKHAAAFQDASAARAHPQHSGHSTSPLVRAPSPPCHQRAAHRRRQLLELGAV
jgi:hypothetical protein